MIRGQRKDIVTRNSHTGIGLDSIKYQGRAFLTGVFQEIDIKNAVQQVPGYDVKGMAQAVDLQLSLPAVGCVSSQGNQITGMVEVMMG